MLVGGVAGGLLSIDGRSPSDSESVAPERRELQRGCVGFKDFFFGVGKADRVLFLAFCCLRGGVGKSIVRTSLSRLVFGGGEAAGLLSIDGRSPSDSESVASFSLYS